MSPDSAEGVLLIDKPQGVTSHDVVDRVRRAFQMKKVGHAGTLDPMATGLLIILVGKATKVSQFLMSLAKTYEGTGRLGEITDSQDADGDVIEEREVPAELDADQLKQEMEAFLGDQYQTPPMFSAKKIKGVPLYKMARKGKEVEREPRVIHVGKFELRDCRLPEFDFSLHCSKGTYVRTIIHDLGENIGCGAHLNRLRRTEIERFSIEQATPLEELAGGSHHEKRSKLIPIHRAVPSHVLG